MRCSLCNGVSHQFFQKTSNDVTVRKYLCKKCRNVFGTIEKKVVEVKEDVNTL